MNVLQALQEIEWRFKELLLSVVPTRTANYGDLEDLRLLPKHRRAKIPGQSWQDKRRESEGGFFLLEIKMEENKIIFINKHSKYEVYFEEIYELTLDQKEDLMSFYNSIRTQIVDDPSRIKYFHERVKLS